MARDASATRARFLAAATAEFAAYGIAGARIDRIAAAAGANKQLIYAYFGGKAELFDAVFEAMVVRAVEEVPITPDDLPAYAGKLFDGYRRHPDVLRLAAWRQLEREPTDGPHPATLRSMTHKVEEIRHAQARGVVSDRFPPDHLLGLILSMASVGAPASAEAAATLGATDAALRLSLINAVRLLTYP